jgi:phosphoribosyl 1,2-cyclic phosphodiesterase
VSGRGIEQVMDIQLQYSYFPIREAEMRARIDYQTLNVGVPVAIGSLTITPLMLNHQVVNMCYRIDGDGKSMFFTGDHEPWLNIYTPEDDGYIDFETMVEAQHTQLDQSLKNLDVLVADSSYTRDEYPSKVGWGHGTMEGHLDWAKRLGVRTLVCTHHEPTRTDDALEQIFANAVAGCGYVPGEHDAPNVLLASEGLEIVL